MKVHWPTVAIVGVGLIGGSVGLALSSRRLAGRIIGVGRSAASLAEAQRRGAVTETTTTLAEGVAAADLVVVAATVGTIGPLLEAVDLAVRPGTLITDAGSTKGSIVAAWEKRRRWRRGRFVGAHPIAGSHKRGPGAADAALFGNRITVVTPVAATPAKDLQEVGDFWKALGSTVVVMPPREHDRILAATSHAPHLLAAAIAAGDPELWADILLDNAPRIARALGRIASTTEKMLHALETNDRRTLVALLKRAKEHRDAVGS